MAEKEEKKEVEGVAPEKTEEETKQAELSARVNEFVKDYGELVLKHKIDFATYPMFVPDGKGGFKIITQSTPVDIGNQPIRSDFMRNG